MWFKALFAALVPLEEALCSKQDDIQPLSQDFFFNRGAIFIVEGDTGGGGETLACQITARSLPPPALAGIGCLLASKSVGQWAHDSSQQPSSPQALAKIGQVPDSSQQPSPPKLQLELCASVSKGWFSHGGVWAICGGTLPHTAPPGLQHRRTLMRIISYKYRYLEWILLSLLGDTWLIEECEAHCAPVHIIWINMV